jgi:hypothetical protein
VKRFTAKKLGGEGQAVDGLAGQPVVVTETAGANWGVIWSGDCKGSRMRGQSSKEHNAVIRGFQHIVIISPQHSSNVLA